MEDNIVVKGNKYFLIDFEDLCLTSRKAEVAKILVDFGKEFDKKQRNLFIDEYSKKNNIKNKIYFEREVCSFIPLIVFSALLWSISHVIRIKNKEFSKIFIENNNLNSNIKHSVKMFDRTLRYGVIEKIYKNCDINEILR